MLFIKKYYFITFICLLGCIIFSSDFINAGGTYSFIGVKLSALGSYYESEDTVSRTSTSYAQEYYSNKTVAGSKEINVRACVSSSSGSVIDCVVLGTNEEDTFGGNSIFTGNYMMKLRRDSVGVSPATHSGVWTY